MTATVTLHPSEIVVATAVHDGARIELVEREWAADERWTGCGAYTEHFCLVDGRRGSTPAGTREQAIAKIAARIDTNREDARIIGDLMDLVGTPADYPIAGQQVGEVAATYAMGRMRTGRIVKVTKASATIAYTTASSNGRVFRKVTKF